MLNKGERYRTLKIYRILSVFGKLPVQVDLASWKLTGPSKRKRCICFLFLGVLVFHMLYKNGSLAYAYFFDPNVQMHQLVIHAVLALGSVLSILFYVMVYISDADLFAAYVNLTLLGDVGGPMDQEDRLINSWKTIMWEYSMEDWIAISLPYLVPIFVPLTIVAYLYDPSMRLLMFAAIPTCLQHWTTFGLALLEEARFILVMATIVVPILQLQVISIDLVSLKLNLLIGTIKNGNHGARSAYMILRSLQLYTSILNKVNRYLIFVFKLLCITSGITTGYSAVAHFREHPIFGVLYYFVLLGSTLVYNLVYGNAFKIPQLFEQATAAALLRRLGPRRDVFKRQILSIPSTGVKVGSFHTLERAFTPIYVDFVVKNIVNLLVSYG